MTILSKSAVEKSTYIIVVSFYDEDDNLITPNEGTVTWTLTDLDGNVINNRENVAIASASQINIVLTGDDLQIGSYGRWRLVKVVAKYDSDTYGSNLDLKDEVKFQIADLTNVT